MYSQFCPCMMKHVRISEIGLPNFGRTTIYSYKHACCFFTKLAPPLFCNSIDMHMNITHNEKGNHRLKLEWEVCRYISYNPKFLLQADHG